MALPMLKQLSRALELIEVEALGVCFYNVKNVDDKQVMVKCIIHD